MQQRNGSISEDDFYVRAYRVYLVDCAFKDERQADAETWSPNGTSFSFGLGFERPAPLMLNVFFNVSTDSEDAPFSLSVTYAAEFDIHEIVPDDRREDVLRYVGYDLAPRLLYVYIREMFTNVTSRWRGNPVVLPLLPVPMRVEGEEEPIPEPPDDVAYQQELLPMAEGAAEEIHEGTTSRERSVA